MSVQTVPYAQNPDAAVAGLFADSAPKRIASVLVEAAIAPGLVVVHGSTTKTEGRPPVAPTAAPTAIVATGGASAATAQTISGSALNGAVGQGLIVPAKNITLVLSSSTDWDATTAVITGENEDGEIITESLAIPNNGNVTVTGTIGTDLENIIGGTGNDRLVGSAFANTLSGGPGDDTLLGGGGADNFNGGDGTDTVSYEDKSATVTAGINGEATSGTTSENDRINADVENLTGGSGNDTLTGDALNNQLLGGLGNDTLRGGLGADTISGGAGNDSIDGGSGSDIIDAGEGNNTVLGGAGDDSASDGTCNLAGDRLNGGVDTDLLRLLGHDFTHGHAARGSGDARGDRAAGAASSAAF